MDWQAAAFGEPGHGALRVVTDLDELRAGVDRIRADGARIGLVPTMGNLHEGHLALVRRARELTDLVMATIFVNPFQFGADEDFDSYPRTFGRDLELLDGAGCHLVFAPPASLVYPHGPDAGTHVQVPGLGDILEGESRPGFFRGVATVVNLLFNMTGPDVALFGKKDYQQLLVIRRMVADLRMRIRIEAVETVRESDGLAMSSRNGYLEPDERARAPAIFRALEAAQGALRGGASPETVEREGRLAVDAAGLRTDYFLVRRRADLEVPGDDDGELVVLAAAFLGRARLIDNIEV